MAERSLAHKALRSLKRKVEDFAYGSIGDIPRRYIPETEFDNSARTEEGRESLIRRYGQVQAPVGREKLSRYAYIRSDRKKKRDKEWGDG